MSHREHHLEGAIKNLIAFENHAETDGCPHCMTKHILAVEQFLGEESEQRNGMATETNKEAQLIRQELPSAYQGEMIVEKRMEELMKRAREVRLKLMKELGVPDHNHRKDRAEHQVIKHEG